MPEPEQSAAPGDLLRRSGAGAERRARWYLWRRGWYIVACNWIGGGGELDIVASRWRTLLVVEVRRRGDDRPLASIDRGKLDRTIAASRALIQAHGLQRYRLRLDLIGFDGAGRLIRRRDVLRQGQPGD
jgi:putative endonuclease